MPVPHNPVRAFLQMHDTAMNPAQQQIIANHLRDGETLLHAATCGAAAPEVVQPKSSFWARLLGKKSAAPATSVAVGGADFYAITSKRVLLFCGSAEPKEWFLMLGMIQQFVEHDNGLGDIVFEYRLTPNGERLPVGLLNIATPQQVHTLLGSAIDAAYNASPWSV